MIAYCIRFTKCAVTKKVSLQYCAMVISVQSFLFIDKMREQRTKQQRSIQGIIRIVNLRLMFCMRQLAIII